VNNTFVGEGGFEFQFSFVRGSDALNISAASVKECCLCAPNGSKTIRTNAQFVSDGSDGLLKYTSVAADFNSPGDWQLQGKVVLAGQEIFSSIIHITAVTPLEDS
jgi:hypothetical protein